VADREPFGALASRSDRGKDVAGGSLAARLRRCAVRFALVVIAAGATLVPAGMAVAKPTFTPQAKAAAIVEPAVVYLEIQWEAWVRNSFSGQLLDPQSVSFVAQCTGFAVSNDGFIATAGHCVDPGRAGVAPEIFAALADRHAEAGTEAHRQAEVTDMMINAEITGPSVGEPAVRTVFAQRGAAKPGLHSGEAIPAQVVSLQPASAGDVALVKVEKSNQPMVTLSDSSDVPVGTDVLAIGYPAAADSVSDATLEPSTRDGTISKAGTEKGAAFFETSAAPTPGMIGGPVASLNGDVVGLVSHGPSAENPAGNLLAASSVISKELAKAGVDNQLGKIDRDFRGGLNDYYEGRYTAAIEKFDQVLAVVPSHAQAQEYRQQAIGLRTTEGDPAPVDLGRPAIFGGAGLLLVGAILLPILLVLRHRRRLGPAATRTHPTEAGQSLAIAGGGSAQAPALTYCANCGQGAPPGTSSCATCGKQFG
jgi:serine protease Do